MIPSQAQIWIFRVVVIVLVLLLLSILVWQYTARSYRPIEQKINMSVTTELETLAAIAVGSGVEFSNAHRYQDLLPNCTREQYQEYEGVLQHLGIGLSNDQLVYLATWFDRCGMRVSHRATVTARVVNDTVAAIDKYYQIHQAIPEPLRNEFPVSKDKLQLFEDYKSTWQTYAASQRALDELQRELIDARLAIEPVDGDRIQDLLASVKERRSQLGSDLAARRTLEEELSL